MGNIGCSSTLMLLIQYAKIKIPQTTAWKLQTNNKISLEINAEITPAATPVSWLGVHDTLQHPHHSLKFYSGAKVESTAAPQMISFSMF